MKNTKNNQNFQPCPWSRKNVKITMTLAIMNIVKNPDLQCVQQYVLWFTVYLDRYEIWSRKSSLSTRSTNFKASQTPKQFMILWGWTSQHFTLQSNPPDVNLYVGDWPTYWPLVFLAEKRCIAAKLELHLTFLPFYFSCWSSLYWETSYTDWMKGLIFFKQSFKLVCTSVLG